MSLSIYEQAEAVISSSFAAVVDGSPASGFLSPIDMEAVPWSSFNETAYDQNFSKLTVVPDEANAFYVVEISLVDGSTATQTVDFADITRASSHRLRDLIPRSINYILTSTGLAVDDQADAASLLEVATLVASLKLLNDGYAGFSPRRLGDIHFPTITTSAQDPDCVSLVFPARLSLILFDRNTDLTIEFSASSFGRKKPPVPPSMRWYPAPMVADDFGDGIFHGMSATKRHYDNIAAWIRSATAKAGNTATLSSSWEELARSICFAAKDGYKEEGAQEGDIEFGFDLAKGSTYQLYCLET